MDDKKDPVVIRTAVTRHLPGARVPSVIGCIAFLLAAGLLCAAVPARARADGFEPERLLAFTRHLIARGEYYRASVELARIGSYWPGHLSPEALHVSGEYLLFRGGRFRDLAAMSRETAPVPGAALLFRCDALTELGEYGAADGLLASWPFGREPFFDAALKKRMILIRLSSRRYRDAAGLCAQAGIGDAGCRELLRLARRGLPSGPKPWAAALLGIAIPGAGYLYAGEYATGFIAFLAVAASAVLTYFAFTTGNEVIGCFTGVAGGFFYAGSIAGGCLAARRAGIDSGGRWRRGLMDAMGFDRDREEIFNRYGIGRDGTTP